MNLSVGLKSLVAFAAAPLLALLASAQPADKPCASRDGRPTVALVLSGGGALASTHVGAIQALEAEGVPIHCVVGTSMGAVVGGMYAAGYTGDELQGFFLNNDWGGILRGDIPRTAKPYLEKERDGQYFSGYVAGYEDGELRLPGGLSTMRGLKTFYRSELAFVPNNQDFDALRVPFRAMATDLSTGEPHALKSGDLVEAILASMAVPSVYPAREIDGIVYIDGGTASQVPVMTAVDLGANIIIAIDTSIEPKPVDATVSVVAATRQLLQIGVWNNRREELAALDRAMAQTSPQVTEFIHVMPSIEGMNVASYNDETVTQGFAYGRAAMLAEQSNLERIKRLAAAPRDRQISRLIASIPTGRDFTVENKTVVSDETIKKRFGFDETKISDGDRTKSRLQDLASFGGFGEVDLGLNPDEAILYVDERGLGRNLIQASLRASNSFNGDSQYAFLARYSRRPFGSTGGEFSLSLEFGTNLGLSAQLYRPMGKEGRFFVAPELFYRSERVIADVGNTRLGEFREQYGGARVRVGRELGSWGIIAFDTEARIGRVNDIITTISNFTPHDFKNGGFGAIFATDTLNKGDWPTEGFRFEASGKRLWDFDRSGSQTDTFNLSGNKAFGYGDTGLLLTARYQGVRNSANAPIEILSLGGFRQLSAFAADSLPTDEYVLGSGEIYHRLTGTEGVINFPVYVGAGLEYARLGLNVLSTQPTDELYSGSAYIGGQTPVGPVFLGAGLGEAGEKSLFFFIGRSF